LIILDVLIHKKVDPKAQGKTITTPRSDELRLGGLLLPRDIRRYGIFHFKPMSVIEHSFELPKDPQRDSGGGMVGEEDGGGGCELKRVSDDGLKGTLPI
jgi:hypothetical protein